MPVVSMRRPDTPAVTLAYAIAAARRIASTVLLECVNPECKKQYSPIAGVLRFCGTCGSQLKPVEKTHKAPEKPGQ
jgi:hypothetical protein